MTDTQHYLERELNDLLGKKDQIVEFLQIASLDGLWYWDLEKPEHEWMSPDFWRTFGYDPSEKQHLASEWQDLIHPDDLQVALVNLKRHCEDPSHGYDQTVRFTHRDGSTVWIRCRGQALHNASGRPTRMLGAHTDLTAIKRSEERLSAFVAALPGLALILDEDGIYHEVMTTRETLLVERSADLIGRTVYDVLPAENAAAIVAIIHDVIESGEPRSLEYSLDTLSGLRWFEGHAVPYPAPSRTGDNPGKRMVVWHAQDISDRKAAELELKAKNEELRQLSYIAAHDLRSPLIAIERATEWLAEDIEADLNVDGTKYLDIIRRRAGRMQNLLDGLLDYARTARSIAPVEIDSRSGLQGAIELAGAEDSPFAVHLGDHLPLIVADGVLFQQIFQNLIGNAIKHHDRDSGSIWIDYEASRDKHVFTVKDDGPGIPARSQERVFQIFQTLKSKDEAEVSGVGLSIVKKAVEAMKGSIAIESGPDRGTTFRITLPRRTELSRPKPESVNG